MLVAILDDDRRLERQAVLGSKWGPESAASRDHDGAFGHHEGVIAEHVIEPRGHVARDFDVLVAWNAQRLSRSFEAYDGIVRATLAAGARLYLLSVSCWVDAASYRAAKPALDYAF